ncbi:hypothetical protein GCM10011375_37250 [Hymenobacter qilianensis]|uniref:Uncharacterized protein n=1 Tax=Hymenobacter qilianensis TaxID=1385715 RepID=A0ACB5PWJ4_9BACT|nr:hypothetical protein GCM10011375_37250 [Hymenobacter qilianensis]
MAEEDQETDKNNEDGSCHAKVSYPQISSDALVQPERSIRFGQYV